MELKFLYPYLDTKKYLNNLYKPGNTWDEIMIMPYWDKISEWAGDTCDFMKPSAIKEVSFIERQVIELNNLDLSEQKDEFARIISILHKDDEDPMTIAFYPSATSLPEGVYGNCVWGNIIICFNILNEESLRWIPYVFAHEYHHSVLGYYWHVINRGKGLKNNLLEHIINEGEADNFAKRLYPDMQPSWLKGVTARNELENWEKLKEVLYITGLSSEFNKYLFGDKEEGIPPYLGYYFGNKIVSSYLEKYPNTSITELIEVPHETIFEKSEFFNK